MLKAHKGKRREKKGTHQIIQNNDGCLEERKTSAAAVWFTDTGAVELKQSYIPGSQSDASGRDLQPEQLVKLLLASLAAPPSKWHALIQKCYSNGALRLISKANSLEWKINWLLLARILDIICGSRLRDASTHLIFFPIRRYEEVAIRNPVRCCMTGLNQSCRWRWSYPRTNVPPMRATGG